MEIGGPGDSAPAIAAALRSLQPDARRAVVMAACGYSVPEIAASLGRTELATRALLCRTRAWLRTSLAEVPGRGDRVARDVGA